jgi:hypothetical protein
MQMHHPGDAPKAIAYTFTIGLVLPAMAVAWLLGTSAVRSLPSAPLSDRPSATRAILQPPVASDVHAAWVSQEAPAIILVQGTADITMVFRNTGRVAWVKGTPSEVRLGIVGDDRTLSDHGYAVAWPFPTRPAVQSEATVAPGHTAAFRFTVRGEAAGKLIIRVRPVMDGVAWLEDEGAYVELFVGAISATADR